MSSKGSIFSFETIIGILSMFIFIYRSIVLMYPMMKQAIREQDIGQFMKSLTLLV
tara:strand:+ start:296 stop:460 length:165 start_codon:yes stop_codon:yes gene_type:complete